MQFPYFQFPLLGDGLIIAINAILHVFISHGVSIGMISMIVLAEYIGFKKGSADWEHFARTAVKPAVIIITGLGAVTGVGIWSLTSGLVPSAIGEMLRLFFWPWFIEWGIFLMEVLAILIYYYTWNSWRGRAKIYHIYFGLAYVILAVISAFLITGILGFMLTSDGWPWDRNFWHAFFNPTFVPQLAWRICVSFSMGALFTIFYLLFSYHRTKEFLREALGVYARIFAFPLILMPFAGYWWFELVPEGFRTHAKPSLLMWAFAKDDALFWPVHIICGIIVIGLLTANWRKHVLISRLTIVPAIIVVMLFVAEFERVREFIRGPYLMPGYMYADSVLLTENDLFRKEGMLKHAYWYKTLVPEPNLQQDGAYLFAQNCGNCHTIGGKNSIVDRFAGRTRKGIYVIIGRTEQMVPWMGPFSGNDYERKLLSDFIYDLCQNKLNLQNQTRYPPLTQETK
jgi:hypothetical protein